jgi:hypothetical protein
MQPVSSRPPTVRALESELHGILRDASGAKLLSVRLELFRLLIGGSAFGLDVTSL